MVRVKWARWAVLALVLLVIGGLSWAILRSGGDAEPELAARKAKPGAHAKNASSDGEPEYVMIGGVRRRRSDVESAEIPEPSEEDLEKARRESDYGTLPMFPADANEQVASVAEALRDQKHPERLSMLARPRQFDPKAYKANPEAYLNVVEPARVFQTAQPGPNVHRLRPVGRRSVQVAQGSSIPLRVAAPPGSPVTFSSFDAGSFDNHLTSITVQANKQGLAEAKFQATPGVIANVHVLAGSPVAAGQVRFVVNVTRDEAAVSAVNGNSGG